MDTSALEGFDTGKRPLYLGIIDGLRELGIGEDVSLPQLVVVGDQSSGKSSLLEGLTGLSFPVAADLCTRFATQIILRKAPANQAGATFTIIPGASSINDENTKKYLAKFSRSMKDVTFGSDALQKVLDDASNHMGLPQIGADLKNVEKRFSDDVLKIELSGPDYNHLSVVDVPGLFQNPTIHQTVEDMHVVRGLITSYISEQRTIILAVMDARHNLANQEVFSMARTADPDGDRTLGIITKCDMVQDEEEKSVIKIAQNTVEKLKHGWYAVRNRSPRDIKRKVTLQERHAKEKAFFSEKPWSDLSKDRVGVPALSSALAALLAEHVRKEFPRLQTEVEEKCRTLRKEIGNMGSSRRTPLEQRQYLTQAASTYQKLAFDSLTGVYEDVSDPQDPLKLRMHVRTLADDFAVKITKEGHLLAFANSDDTEDEAYHLEHEVTRQSDVNTERDEKNSLSIYVWIKQAYLQSRGCELPGTVNPAVIEALFRRQTEKWQEVAEGYINSVKNAVDSFLAVVITRIATDPDVRSRLHGRLTPVFDNAHRKAHQILADLLADEQRGILQTVNDDFASSLAAAREDRVVARLSKLGIQDGESYTVDLNALKRATQLSNVEQSRNDIHDILKAYYKVAIKRFMDGVVNACVERSFFGLEGCTKAFTASFVGRLSDDELYDIAGESLATTNMRKELEDKLQRFEKASQIAKVH